MPNYKRFITNAALRYRMSQGRCYFRVDIAALISDASAFQDVVIHVDFQSALVIDKGHKAGEVARVELAGVSGNRGGQVQRAKDNDAVVIHVFTGFGESHVAAGRSGKVDYHRTGAHAI